MVTALLQPVIAAEIATAVGSYCVIEVNLTQSVQKLKILTLGFPEVTVNGRSK
jgi:hypothetical protein